jgi:hypothetical protein
VLRVASYVTPQDRASLVNVNMFYRLVSQVIISLGGLCEGYYNQEAYVMIRTESLDAKGQ